MVLKAVEDGQADPEDDVSRHLPNDPIIPDGVVDCADIEDGVDVIEGPVLPVLDLGKDLIRHVRYEALRGLKTIDIHERVGDLAGAYPLGIHGDDLLIDVRNVFLPLL